MWYTVATVYLIYSLSWVTADSLRVTADSLRTPSPPISNIALENVPGSHVGA